MSRAAAALAALALAVTQSVGDDGRSVTIDYGRGAVIYALPADGSAEAGTFGYGTGTPLRFGQVIAPNAAGHQANPVADFYAAFPVTLRITDTLSGAVADLSTFAVLHANVGTDFTSVEARPDAFFGWTATLGGRVYLMEEAVTPAPGADGSCWVAFEIRAGYPHQFDAYRRWRAEMRGLSGAGEVLPEPSALPLAACGLSAHAARSRHRRPRYRTSEPQLSFLSRLALAQALWLLACPARQRDLKLRGRRCPSWATGARRSAGLDS
ncbi:MAG: hypothetical protein U0797_30585 [Gemmataceae bacterium]